MLLCIWTTEKLITITELGGHTKPDFVYMFINNILKNEMILTNRVRCELSSVSFAAVHFLLIRS